MRPQTPLNPRILHLVDLTDRAGTAALACSCAVARLPGVHSVWTIGHAPLPGAWLAPSRRLGAPLGSPLAAWAALRRALRGTLGTFDLVTCWSVGALGALHLACPRGTPPTIGVLASDRPGEGSLVAARTERAALARHAVLCFSESAACRWRRAGATDVRVAPPRLGLDHALVPTRDDARAALGIAPREHVLALLADPPEAGDARRFAYLAGLLSVGGAPTVALVHERSAQLRRGARFVRECGRLWRILPFAGPLATALPACDAAVVDSRVHRTHPLLYPPAGSVPEPTADALAVSLAVNLGVPVVVPRLSLADELQAAGIPVIRAADASCLSLAAAIFPFMDARPAASQIVESSPAAGALTVLADLWSESLNAPSPGFPLLSSSVPASSRRERSPEHPPSAQPA
jgi:hypothetical protein